jgi:anti-anti-sigma factor
MFKHEQLKSKCKARIEGEMTIYNAAELGRQLIPVLDDPRPLEINLARVSELDSAGVQLLMLAKKERERAGHKLNLVEHSEAVVDVFELMGLLDYFNDPVVLTKGKGGKHGT